MKNELVLKNEANRAIQSDEILKTTALIYFNDALLQQDYEQCPELISLAKQFGAQPGEIKQVIASYLKGSYQNEAKYIRR